MNSREPARNEDPEVREWWVTRSARHALLVGSATTGALGLSLTLAGRLAWDHYAPVELLIMGAGMLAASAVVRPQVAPETAANPPGVPGTASPRIARTNNTTAALGLARSSTGSHESAREILPPASSLPSRIFATSRSNPAEFLWESWAPTLGRLPVELVGPVPETAYVTPRSGRPQLHEEGEPIVLEPSYFDDDGIDWGTTNRFDTLGTLPPRPIASITSQAAGCATGASLPPATSPQPGVGANSVGSAVIGTPVLTEALNPTPPHLRPRPSKTKSHVPQPRRSENSLDRPTRCADCRQLVREPKIWRRCPDCRRQLCTHCIVEALVAYEEGWCSHCAGLRNLELLTREITPRARSKTRASYRKKVLPPEAPRLDRAPRGAMQPPDSKVLDRAQELGSPRTIGQSLGNPTGPKVGGWPGGYAASLLREFGAESMPRSGSESSNGAAI